MAISPVLRRFDIFVYQNLSSTDPAQVPASATISFFKQGATVKSDVLVPYTDPALIDPSNPDPPPATEVPVWHAGSIGAQDLLQYDVNSWATFTVATPDSGDPVNAKILLWNTSVQPSLLVAAGGRLVRLSSPPKIYLDPTGASQSGLPVQTDPLTGRAGCYLRESRYDYMVSISGLTPRLYPDAEGSFVMR